MLFSIIIPVYNVKDYIRECIDSVIGQTMQDFEIILVDDGSTDGSAAICDEYAEKCECISVLHKENGGLSSARNAGINVAKGEFLVFLDSDDYIETNSLYEIQRAIKQDTDVIVTRMVHDYPDSSEVRNDSICELIDANSEECFKWIFEKSANTWPAPQYIVRLSFVKENNLHFAEGYLHEDLDWTSRLFLSLANINVCVYPWYHHRLAREGSITTESNPKRVVDVYRLAAGIHRDYKDLPDFSSRYQSIRERIVSSMISILIQFHRCSPAEKRVIIHIVEENDYLFKNAKNKKARLYCIMKSILGCRNTLAIFSYYQNRKR